MICELKKQFDEFFALSHAGHSMLLAVLQGTSESGSSQIKPNIIASALDCKLEVHRSAAFLKLNLLAALREEKAASG